MRTKIYERKMRIRTLKFALVLTVYFTTIQCLPLRENDGQDLANNNIDVFQEGISLQRESLLNNKPSEGLIRNKRTIGVLRQLFPGLSQIIDRKIQQLTRVAFRIVGRLILRGNNNGGGTGGNGAGGNDSNGDGSGGGRRISITLPTYPPFEDDQEEGSTETAASPDSAAAGAASVPVSNEENAEKESGPSTENGNGNGQSAAENANGNGQSSTDNANGNGISSAATEPAESLQSSSTAASITTTINSSPVADSENNLPNDSGDSDSESVKRGVRDSPSNTENNSVSTAEDEASKVGTTKSRRNRFAQMAEALRNRRANQRQNRKNTGNFIQDILKLVVGSGNGVGSMMEGITRDERDGGEFDDEEEREKEASNEGSSVDENTYTAGIPGPLTRLLVLTNRGISSLIQDLILRLAQTSERIISYKSRLITAVI